MRCSKAILRGGIGLLALGLAGGLAACGTLAQAQPRRSEGLPPPLDPAVALDRSFARAVAEDSNAALLLFIARNPDTTEAEAARRLLARRPGLDPLPYRGPDGPILEAFDRARLAGPEALAAFAARYRDSHPLGAEALDPAWTRPAD